MADAEIENMRRRMTEAAQADTNAREKGQPAMQKLKLLPEVVALLNRNTIQSQLVDPDINLLEAVRFFLEPLNDGSLPAYNIQKELFAALGKLPINKDALVASGIGKVVLFYTRSNRPEQSIKRQAERLLSEWMRPILKRSDDYRKRDMQKADYDPRYVPMPIIQPPCSITLTPISRLPIRNSQGTPSQASQAARERALAPPGMTNRARVEGGVGTYTIAPKSNIQAGGMLSRAPGHGSEEAFRRMKMRQAGKSGGGRR
jgi:transcription factor SPN1